MLREMVRIPAGLFMRVAETVGAAVLIGWQAVWPVLVRAWAAAGRALAWAERTVTPARGAVAAAALVAILLALSQFATYHQVVIGAPEYTEVEAVAPPPPVERADAGSAHLWLGIPLGLLALGIVVRSATGRWKAARLLAAVGVAVVAISLAIDMPKGLDEGNAAIVYQGASAELLGGFWMQLMAGVTLIFMAPILTRLLEPRARAAAASAPRRVQPIRAGIPGGGSLRLPRMPASRARPASGAAAGGPRRRGRGRTSVRVGRPTRTREAGG